jgi:exonuclease III
LKCRSRRFFKIHKRSRKVGTAFEIEKRKGAEDNKHRRYTTLDYREIKMLCIVLYLVNREEKKKNSPYRYQHYQSLSNVVAENNLQSLKS